MAKKVAKKTSAPADVKMYVVSAAVSKKAGRDLFYDEDKTKTRHFSAPSELPSAVAVYNQWESQSDYYRDVRLHEIGSGKRVVVKTEIIEE